MDLLNNFWNILITENELLTKFLTIPTIPIEAFLLFRISTSLLKINYTKKAELAYILLLTLNSLVTKFLITTPYNVYVNYLIMFIIIKSIFHTNAIKTIIAIIFPTVIFALIGIIILKPILLMFNLSSSQAQYTPIYQYIYLIILYLVVFLLLKLFNKLHFNLFPNGSLDKNSKFIITLNFILGFFTLGIQLAVTAFYTDVLPFMISILSFISLFAYFFISFYSFNRVMKLQITTQNLQNAENYNKTLSILYDNVKAFKHDFDNMIFTIGGFVNTNDIDGLRQYYASLERECQKVNNLALLNPTLINNSGIYSLLTAKYQKAHNSKVDIDLEFFFDLNKLHMPIYDFSRMLGILLDNAIEAASVSKEKVIKIMFRDSINSKVQIVEIKNSYINKNIDTKNIFNKGITEKKNHLGMGLWEVNQIISKNNNINLFTENDNLYFTQRLEIYY